MAEKPAEQQDPQKAYLSEQLNKISGEIGEGYGEPLLEELMNRLEKTVADFHEEVTEMLVNLKKQSIARQEKLKDRWTNKEDAPAASDAGASGADSADEPQAESSDWEKRIEDKEAKAGGGKKEAKTEEEEKPKKKGFFGRKKKKKD